MKIKDKKMLAFVAGSSAGLILTIAWPSKEVADTPLSEPARASPDLTEDARWTARYEQLIVQRARSEELVWGRDPFRAPETPSVLTRATPHRPVQAALSLTGICAVAGKPMAIINREIVEPGGRLASGHTVTEIGSRTATLLLDGKERILRLGDER